MMSTAGRRIKSGETSPQVRPSTRTLVIPFAWQLRRQFSRHRARSALSDKVTAAPHDEATTPGRAVPAPNYRELFYYFIFKSCQMLQQKKRNKYNFLTLRSNMTMKLILCPVKLINQWSRHTEQQQQFTVLDLLRPIYVN